MPKRDLSPAAVAEILAAHYEEHRTIVSAHKVREALATRTIDTANGWVNRAIADGAVTCLVANADTGKIIGTVRPRVEGDPPNDDLDGWLAHSMRNDETVTAWADTEWADVESPCITWDGKIVLRATRTFESRYPRQFVVPTEDVEALCRQPAKDAEREAAKRKAAEDALAEATDDGVARIEAALVALGVPTGPGAVTAMLVGGNPTLMLTIRGADAIRALADTLTERTTA